MKSLVIFDGDDTLWISEPLYDRAREAARNLVKRSGLNGDRWEQLEREIDVANVARFGLSAKRFPTSCVEAYVRLANESGSEIDMSLVHEIRVTAESVFSQLAPLVPGTNEVLEALAPRAFLALLTQGDPRVQELRLSRSGLESLFDAVHGVSRKTPETFQALLEQFRVRPAESWSVGNSLASDINPALKLGLNAIWIQSHVWEYERRESHPASERMKKAESLTEVPFLIFGDTSGSVAVV